MISSNILRTSGLPEGATEAAATAAAARRWSGGPVLARHFGGDNVAVAWLHGGSGEGGATGSTRGCHRGGDGAHVRRRDGGLVARRWQGMVAVIARRWHGGGGAAVA